MNASTQTATQTPARADRRKSVVDPREHRLGGEQSSRLSSLGIAGNGVTASEGRVKAHRAYMEAPPPCLESPRRLR